MNRKGKNMNRMELLDKLISALVVFITTIIAPNIISNFIKDNLFIYLLTAVISLLLLIILYLIKLLLTTYVKIHLKSSYKTMRLYAISSSFWCDLFSNENIHVEKCVILVRSYIDKIGVSKDSYDKEVDNSKNRWIKLLHEGRINQLRIYSYESIPDIYYCILDNKILFSGLNCYDALDSTGQYGNRKAQVFHYKRDKEIIENYIKHFDNYVQNHSSSVIYDSTSSH